MRPPLPVGSILQNRYRILSLLGQGGFGRTYLSEDQGRFNERCALKELTPAQGDAYALDKSRELFQREAQTLYQIQHPQIPQFRATFEQDQRLFLVQDYVEGQTYRQLLDQRKTQGLAFAESEVLQLMQQILPVLAHIHAKGIVHRDIAPDNIMLRQQDNKPVLIDFGVVKELATRFQTMMTGVAEPTTVGKPGYAPSEQMQTGKAYPSSDLYSLAVTAVVLMTGHEPQELFDDTTMTWYWQRWVTVNPGLAQILNRMLSYRPGDRYQSVSEVAQALQAITNPGTAAAAAPVNNPPPVAVAPPPASPPAIAQNPPTQLSRMQTVAVGRRAAVEPAPANPPQRSTNGPAIEEPRSSIWDDPLAIIATGIALVILTGLGSWLIMRAILDNRTDSPPIATPSPSLSPSVTPSPSPSLSPSPSPSPKPPEPVNYTKRLNLSANSTVGQNGVLKANESMTYIINGQQGQIMESIISGEGVLMTVYAPDSRPVDDNAQRVSYWQGALPYNGDYFVELKPVQGLESGRYDIDISLRSEPQPPSPSPSPSPEPPQINEIVVEFEPGETSERAYYSDRRVNANRIDRYLISAKAGNALSAEVNSRRATLRVYDPSGREITKPGDVTWQVDNVPYASGTYLVDVIDQSDTRGSRYDLSLTRR